ncbi:MAG TPA: preprotein translocase subunit YajC [Candidatus Acidoferrales bacterium]
MIIAFMAPFSGILVAQAAAQPSPWGVILLPVALIAVFYFLMIRPAHTQRKKVGEMLKSLKVGDKVITNGGLYGTIAALEEDAVQLRIAEQVKVKMARSAIGGLQQEKKES